MSWSETQALDALTRANKVRLTRASVRRAISDEPRHTGIRSVALIVLADDELWATAKLSYLLTAPDRVGPSFVARWLREADLQPTKQLGTLTERQRQALADVLLAAAATSERNARERTPCAA